MPLFQQGTTKIGGFRLPDFGISERLGIGQGNQAVRQSGALAYSPPQQAAYSPPSSPPGGGFGALNQRGSVLGATAPTVNTQLRGSGVSGGGTSQMAGQQTQQDNINRQVDDFGQIIDRDYETTMGALSGQESGLRGQAVTNLSVQDTNRPKALLLKNKPTERQTLKVKSQQHKNNSLQLFSKPEIFIDNSNSKTSLNSQPADFPALP
jgi:hypothetical protein